MRHTLRNRSQPFAIVRNRPREGCMAVPMASSAKVLTFGSFKPCIASFRVQMWHFVTFQHVHNVSKVFLCGMPGRRGLFASVSGDDYHFSVQHFGCVHVHVAWHAQNFRRVVLHVFANCIVRLRQVVTTCKRVAGVGQRESVILRGRGNIWCRSIVCEYHFAWQAQFFGHFTLYTPHSAPTPTLY